MITHKRSTLWCIIDTSNYFECIVLIINLNEIRKLENLIKKKELNTRKERTIFVFDRFANFFCDERLRSKGVNTMLNVLSMVGKILVHSCASATSRVASFIASLISFISFIIVSQTLRFLFFPFQTARSRGTHVRAHPNGMNLLRTHGYID